jgi:hypothetical protein
MLQTSEQLHERLADKLPHVCIASIGKLQRRPALSWVANDTDGEQIEVSLQELADTWRKPLAS